MTGTGLSPEELKLWRQSRCITCGNEYEPMNNEQMFCGPTCRQRKYRERFRAQADHRQRTRAPRSATCGDCGVEFRCGSRGMLPRRCPECKKAARRAS